MLFASARKIKSPTIADKQCKIQNGGKQQKPSTTTVTATKSMSIL